MRRKNGIYIKNFGGVCMNNDYVVCEDGRVVTYEAWLEEQKNK